MASIMHSPFDPELLKSWLLLLLWFAALCALVGGPVLFYLWLVWRGRRQPREAREEESRSSPDTRAI
jgi:hypothetical protein